MIQKYLLYITLHSTLKKNVPLHATLRFVLTVNPQIYLSLAILMQNIVILYKSKSKDIIVTPSGLSATSDNVHPQYSLLLLSALVTTPGSWLCSL